MRHRSERPFARLGRRSSRKLGGGFLLGASLGLVFVPCAGPVLAVITVPRRLVAEAIDIIVFISGRGLDRRIESIARVAGLDPDGNYGLVDLLTPANSKGE